jgi:hypothetical protein
MFTADESGLCSLAPWRIRQRGVQYLQRQLNFAISGQRSFPSLKTN